MKKRSILYIVICISFYLFMRLLFGDFSLRNSLRNTNDSEDIQAIAERYFDSLKATKQIKEVSELINDTTKLIDSGFFEGGQDFLTVDDFIRHFEDFKPIYKASMSPRGYEVASKFMSKISNLKNADIMMDINGVPYFLKLPKEMDFNWIVYKLWFKLQDEATQIKSLERLGAKPSAKNKWADDSVKTVKE